ncbi:MAG: HD domain-containing protein [Candidatus Peregrinibacteria bacterium]|nr:HD domain-containing protein [Candidatus Peregrinibacteria bacterium]
MNTAAARPTFLPPVIESIPSNVTTEKSFWRTHPSLQLSQESAEEFLRSSQIVNNLYSDRELLESLDLNPNLPGVESQKGHGMRVAILALLLNDELERQGSELQGDRRILTTAALLHDIGKLRAEINEVIMRPEKILKGGTKSASDALAWTIIRRHPRIGFNTVSNMFNLEDDERGRVAWAIYCHHERQDGKGYHKFPLEKVSNEAQIISVTDGYDVMTGNRPYQKAKSHEAAIKEERRCNRQYNQQLVDTLASIQPENGGFFEYLTAA